MDCKSVWRGREFSGLWEELKGNHVLQKQLTVWSRKYRKDIKLCEELRGFMYNLLCLSMVHFWFKVLGYVRNLKEQVAFFLSKYRAKPYIWTLTFFTDIKTDTHGKADITAHIFFSHLSKKAADCTKGTGGWGCNSLCQCTQTISYHKTSLMSCGKKRRGFSLAWENKQWHSFQSSLLYVRAHICRPPPPPLFFPNPNQFLMELLHYSMETA